MGFHLYHAWRKSCYTGNTTRMCTHQELLDGCTEALRDAGLLDGFEYFGISYQVHNPDIPIPAARWHAAYTVEGGSEGWYLHVDAIGILETQGRETLLVGKTLKENHEAIELMCGACLVITRLLWEGRQGDVIA